jgi:hypothetical protein
MDELFFAVIAQLNVCRSYAFPNNWHIIDFISDHYNIFNGAEARVINTPSPQYIQ